MKKLQNNYTTPEQSKRLVELGIPIESADIIYYHTPDSWHDPYFITEKRQIEHLKSGKGLPCWSVGRLIEVYLLCAEEPTNFVTNVIFFKGNNMSNIEVLIDSIKTTSMDFSKLEK